MDWDALRARGMRLSPDEFWHPEKGGVLSAAVQINGCSASFCSPEGLVVTNNHVVTGAALLRVFVPGSDEPVNAQMGRPAATSASSLPKKPSRTSNCSYHER